MEDYILTVSDAFARTYEEALKVAKRDVKHTLLPPEGLILAMMETMLRTSTIVQETARGRARFVDYIPHQPTMDEVHVQIRVPMPPKGLMGLLRDRDWEVMRGLNAMLQYERVADGMTIAEHVTPDAARLMAGGYVFWAITRTAHMKRAVTLKTLKPAKQHEIVRRPRTVQQPIEKGGLPELPRNSLYKPTR